MKIMFWGAVALTLLGTAAWAEEPAAFKTELEKTSYAMGMDIAVSLKKQLADVDADAVARGFKDAYGGGKTLLTPEEMRTIMAAYQEQVRAKQAEARKAAGEKNAREGKAFLEANKGKEGVVTLPSGLQYKVLTQGSGPTPTLNDAVECHYRGKLLDGTEFDSSYKRGRAAHFPVKGVIKGWTEALQLMPVGSKWELFIPAELAYADRGAGAAIGPEATLVFEVELLGIEENPQGTKASPKRRAPPRPKEEGDK